MPVFYDTFNDSQFFFHVSILNSHLYFVFQWEEDGSQTDGSFDFCGVLFFVFFLAAGWTDPGPTQLCHYDKVHQQAREPQTDHEPPSR